jgi:hypothetical protein
MEGQGSWKRNTEKIQLPVIIPLITVWLINDTFVYGKIKDISLPLYSA